MIYWIGTLLIGINICPLVAYQGWFVGKEWACQAYFFIFMSLVGLCLSLNMEEINKQKRKKDIPLFLLFGWITIQSFYMFVQAQQYDVFLGRILFYYIPILGVILIYKFLLDYATYFDFVKTIEIIKWVVYGSIFISVLQYFGLSQITYTHKVENQDIFFGKIVGFVFNGTHFSAFLAMLSAVFFYTKNKLNYVLLILITIILCLSGTVEGSTSRSGFIIFWFTIFYFSKYKREILLMTVAFGLMIIKFVPTILPKIMHPNGRLEIWDMYWHIFKEYINLKGYFAGPLTGAGLGFVKDISKLTKLPEATHIHNEPFEFLIELGIIGFCLLCFFIIKFLHEKPHNEISKVYKCIVLSFFIAFLFNPSAHVAVLSVFVIVAYAGFKLTNEKNHPYYNLSAF